jgi:hypothetical protein
MNNEVTIPIIPVGASVGDAVVGLAVGDAIEERKKKEGDFKKKCTILII